MALDPQIAAVVQQFSGLAQPDFTQLQASQYRRFSDNLMPLIPGAQMHEVRELRVAGAAGELDARLYRPLDRQDLPLLVFFHGGGFVMGNLDTHDNLCRSLAEQVEAVVVSIAYRLAPENRYPAAPLDGYQATCWLVEHAAELGYDASRLALAGDSAGANLAIAVSRQAAASNGPSISYQCLFYPLFADGYLLSAQMMRWFWQQYLERPEQADDALASPLGADDLHGLPPTSVFTAEYDPLRDEGEVFAQRLSEAGVTTRLRRCEGMIHGFVSMAPFVDGGAKALAQAAADLRTALG
jgi:acetyl esterase